MDIRPDHLEIVQDILREHLSADVGVWVFGSRASWATKDSSDLDLVLEGEGRLSNKSLGALKDAFEDSALPYTVDVVDFNRIGDSFRQIVELQRTPLPRGGDGSDRRPPPVSHLSGGTASGGAPLTPTSTEWREVTFSEAVLVNPAVRLDRGSVYPFVDMAAVNADSRSAYPRDERPFKGNGSRFQSGDTLMARITPCLENGKIARYHASQDKRKAHGSTEFIIIRGRPNVTDNDFAYYLTQWNEVREYAISQMTGTSGRQRVPANSLDHLTISIPPLPEQRAIAHVLGALDDKIELNRRMNQTLEEMARALFKSWFVDFDPVRAKMEGRDPGLPPKIADLFPDRLAESELGEIPAGWGVGRFSDAVTQLRGKENPLTSPDTVFSHFSIPAYDEGQIPKYELGENIKSSKSRVEPDVVLVSKLNPEIERVWLVDVATNERAVCSTEFLVFQARPPFQRSYIYCLACSHLFRQQIESLVTGTSRSHQRAPASDILSLNMLTPPVQIIDEFEMIASEFLNDTLYCLRESRTLAALRDALLPKLVSGTVRV